MFEIETILQRLGKSHKEIDGIPQPDPSLLKVSGNRLLYEELNYDTENLKVLHEQPYSTLSLSQKIAYDAIIQSVDEDENLIFINGHGGIGKTFLWNTIITKIRSSSKIILHVATSGITTLLLPNGRIAHSQFQIPLDITTESTCDIQHGTKLATLLL